MPEYDLAFANKLSETAALLANQSLSGLDAKRTVLYLGLVATEIAMKAMLEKAGEPTAKIRKHSHDLRGLARDLGKCKVEVEIAPGTKQHVPATRLRAIEVNGTTGKGTVGQILDAEAQGASRYPNQVRYGPLLRHYPAEVIARMASEVVKFAEEHWGTIHK